MKDPRERNPHGERLASAKELFLKIAIHIAVFVEALVLILELKS